MGWVLHHYDNIAFNYGGKLEPSDTVDDFPGVSVVYLRIAWSYLEPQEGRFNWSVLDTPAQRWLDKGKQIALRISCSESFMRYATPEWVQKAGAKGYNFNPRKGVDPNGPYWEPDYDDPVFLEKLDHFLAALAQPLRRQSGGRLHRRRLLRRLGRRAHLCQHAKALFRRDDPRHIDLHTKHFKKTLLAANDDFALHDRGRAPIEYAAQQGLALRDDSILVQGGKNAYLSADFAPLFWQKVPVILESEHYGPSRDRGNWKDGSQYLEAIEKYHASYASVHWWPQRVPGRQRGPGPQNQPAPGLSPATRRGLLAERDRRRLDVLVHDELAQRRRRPLPARRLPRPDDQRRQRRNRRASSSMRAWTCETSASPSPAKLRRKATRPTSPCRWPPTSEPGSLKPGEYEVYVSVGTPTGTPKIALPLPNDDGHHRYRLGKLTVQTRS